MSRDILCAWHVNKVCIVSPKRIFTYTRTWPVAGARKKGRLVLPFIPLFFLHPRFTSSFVPSSSSQWRSGLVWEVANVHGHTARKCSHYVPTNSNRVRFTIGLFVRRSWAVSTLSSDNVCLLAILTAREKSLYELCSSWFWIIAFVLIV